MRIRTLAWLLLGIVGVLALRATRRTRRRARSSDIPAPDPQDPAQGFDEASELYIVPLDGDAQPITDAEAAVDLATYESDLDEGSLELDVPSQTDADAIANASHDSGDLYGVHVPPAVDRDIPDDDRAYEDGTNWLEALERSAAESGAEPERELDIVDDSDDHDRHHATDTRDIPVADRGSAGPRGL